MSERYFRLNPECFLITGTSGSVIHNLYTGEAIWCDWDNTQVLARSERNQPIDPDLPLFHSLAERQWGLFSDQPLFIDKLRAFNVFREKRIWKETPYISLAVLQVANTCQRACATCTTAFCPICTVRPASEDDPLTTAEWLALITRLREYGTQWIVFTGGESLLRDDLVLLVQHACALGVAVQVHTSGLLPLPADLPQVALSVLLLNEADLPVILGNLGDHPTVTLLNDGVDEALIARYVGARLRAGWRVTRTSAAPPTITKDQLVVTKFDRFVNRLHRDDCLFGKIYVAHDGAVLPCFGYHGEPLAHLRRNSFPQAVEALVDQIWNVPVHKLDPQRPCTRCEYRMSCTACRYLDVGRQCQVVHAQLS